MYVCMYICMYVCIFPLPPSSVLCCFGATIDPFGDHLITCLGDRLRVQHRNVLCEVVFQVLFVENRHVKREQNFSGYDSSRPGNLHHPHFTDG